MIDNSIADLYAITFRDSKIYRKEGELCSHYQMKKRGRDSHLNYKYFIACDHIGEIAFREEEEIYERYGINYTEEALRQKYNLNPNISFGV